LSHFFKSIRQKKVDNAYHFDGEETEQFKIKEEKILVLQKGVYLILVSVPSFNNSNSNNNEDTRSKYLTFYRNDEKVHQTKKFCASGNWTNVEFTLTLELIEDDLLSLKCGHGIPDEDFIGNGLTLIKLQ